MNKNIEDVLETIKAVFNFNVIRRMFFLGSIAASVAVGVSMYGFIQEPDYQPLSYHLNDQTLPAIIDLLEKAHIPFKIKNDMIFVPTKNVLAAKIKLVSAGIPKDDSFSFSYLNETNKLGTSQFLENARYVRALESDLAKTISSIQYVSGAKVHIAIPQNNIFADENAKTTASIIINLAPGHDGDKEKVHAIIQLVAASVPELDPANVAITDQYGHYLSSMLNPDSILNQEQLSYQNSIQHDYEKRIQGFITSILGANKASINVNAEIDFTVQEQSKEEYDPTQKAIRSEQSVSESTSSGGASGVPGALSNQPPSGGTQASAPASGSDSRSESIKNYELTKSTTYVKTASPKIKNVSVAVVLDNDNIFDEKTKKTVSKPLDKITLDKITELVKSTIGFNEKRGDRVTVINAGFTPITTESYVEPPLWETPWFWDVIKKILGIVVGSILVIWMYRKFMPEWRGGLSHPGKSEERIGLARQVITPEMLQLKNEQLQILKELAAKEPNKVVGIIKKWVEN